MWEEGARIYDTLRVPTNFPILVWYMSPEHDIHVLKCMDFVLVKLFDEWVYNFFNDSYLSGEDLIVFVF